MTEPLENEFMSTNTWLGKIRLLSLAILLSASAAMTVRAGSPHFVGAKDGQRASMDKIDHAPWTVLLKKYVNADGMVNYRAWKADSGDSKALARYLRGLSAADVRIKSTRDAKLAFWINAYNAVTIHGILREYPTDSIRNHTARLFGYNIWHDLQLYVGGAPYSLDTIEHKILRKMNEPRIHFAIVCASISCPRLLNEAYEPDRINEQLELNAKDFFARAQNFRYDAASKRFHLSAILDWFGDDFGANQSARLRRISGWLPNTAAQTAAQRGTVKVSHLEYNWQLNKQ